MSVLLKNASSRPIRWPGGIGLQIAPLLKTGGALHVPLIDTVSEIFAILSSCCDNALG